MRKKWENQDGLSQSPLYLVWAAMKRRCYNKKDNRYYKYGKNGIVVCEEWLNSFKSFYYWSIQNGWSSGLYIDRIDNNKSYCPKNCRFVKPEDSNRNQSHSKYWFINGKRFDSSTLAAKHFNVGYKTIHNWCNGSKDKSGKYYPAKEGCFSINKY